MLKSEEKKKQTQNGIQFVNYHKGSTISKEGLFKVTRRQKHEIPNVTKFKVNITKFKTDGTQVKEPTDSLQSNSQVQHTSIPVQTPIIHTFSSTSAKLIPDTRKSSYTISTLYQRITLVQLVKKHRLYKRKPQIEAWCTISKQYNSLSEIDDSEGLTSQHAKTKFNKILKTAEKKAEKDAELDYAEELILDYKREKESYELKNKVKEKVPVKVEIQ